MARRPKSDLAEYEARVLQNFVDPSDRLVGIPVQRKKRMVILRWLAEDFQLGRQYPEARSTRSSRNGTRTSRHYGGTSSTRS